MRESTVVILSVLKNAAKFPFKTALLCFCLVASPLFSLNAETAALTEIIDVPTADVVEYSHYNLGFRLYGGGVLTKMVFGVFKPINIGMSWDIDKMLGSGSEKIDTRPPAIFFKARVFAGGMMIPAIALGYDGQGYGAFDKPGITDQDKYQYREKGIFVTLTREYFVPGLTLSCGTSISDFGDESFRGFSGATYSVEDRIIFMGEYDNIHSKPENRINLGAALLIASNIDIEVAGRNLFKGPSSERTAIIKYKGKF